MIKTFLGFYIRYISLIGFSFNVCYFCCAGSLDLCDKHLSVHYILLYTIFILTQNKK